MGLVLVLTYIGLYLLSPVDMVPALAPFRPNPIPALASLPLTLMDRLRSPELGKLRTQLILVVLFLGWGLGSWLPHGQFGANLVALPNLTPNVIVHFAGMVELRTPFRLGLVRTVLALVAIFVMTNAFMEIPYATASWTSTGVSTLQAGVPAPHRSRQIGEKCRIAEKFRFDHYKELPGRHRPASEVNNDERRPAQRAASSVAGSCGA